MEGKSFTRATDLADRLEAVAARLRVTPSVALAPTKLELKVQSFDTYNVDSDGLIETVDTLGYFLTSLQRPGLARHAHARHRRGRGRAAADRGVGSAGA